MSNTTCWDKSYPNAYLAAKLLGSEEKLGITIGYSDSVNLSVEEGERKGSRGKAHGQRNLKLLPIQAGPKSQSNCTDRYFRWSADIDGWDQQSWKE